MTDKVWNAFLSVIGLICVLSWILLFVAGLFVDSQPYRNQLSEHRLASLPMASLLYTPTNAAILTCLSGLIGGISSNLTYNRIDQCRDTNSKTLSDIGPQRSLIRTENPFASMLRSFVVFLLCIAGLTIAAPENPFSQPTQEQYLRVVGLLSVLGFGVGYDPTVFQRVLGSLPMAPSKLNGPKD
jgi:hypothetical protein